MNIRDMKIDDAERVAEIHVDAWRAAYTGILSSQILDAICLEKRVERWRDVIIPQSDRNNVVIIDDKQICGWSSFGETRDEDKDKSTTGELYGMYICPNQFRKGLGTLLWQETCKRLQENAVITLWVLSNNLGARMFYESMGFVLDGQSQRTPKWLDGAEEVRYTFVC